MPKVEMDYSKTVIYKICCKDINITDIYIGHTTSFIKRKNCHKHNCINPNSNHHNLYVYKFIRDNNGWNNWDMIEIEKYNCNDRLEALKKERYWIEELKATLNKQIPSRTKQEYNNDNREQINELNKEYYKNNREQINELNKEYYKNNKNILNAEIHCDICNCNYTRRNKSRHEKTQKHQNILNNK